jgi:Type II CAAX prenyl endopeptidase Rce1-like
LRGPRKPASGPTALGEAARTVGWALALDTAVTSLGALLAQHRPGSLAAQAFAAEWGAGRLAVAWSDPEQTPPSGAVVARRVAKGALYGLGAAGVVLGFALLTHAATFGSTSPAPTDILMGVILAGLIAMRDELLLRGVVLRAFRHTLGQVGLLLTCAAVAAAARLGEAHDQPLASVAAPTLLVAGLSGLSFATLWLRERGAWTAWGAHTVWTAATTTAIDGSALQVRWATSAWGGDREGLSGSLAVASALALVAASASFAWYRTRKR